MIKNFKHAFTLPNKLRVYDKDRQEDTGYGNSCVGDNVLVPAAVADER